MSISRLFKYKNEYLECLKSLILVTSHNNYKYKCEKDFFYLYVCDWAYAIETTTWIYFLFFIFCQLSLLAPFNNIFMTVPVFISAEIISECIYLHSAN